MSVLQMLTDGASHAARAAALLFTLPLAAHAGTPAAEPDVRVVDAAFEVRVVGRFADLRVVEALRNHGAAAADLGGLVAGASESDAIARLALTRDGRTVDLLAPLGGCGDEEMEQPSRAIAALDESIADVMQLAPGEQAELVIDAVAPLQAAGSAFRIALPASVAPLAPQARVADGDASAIVIVPPPFAGEARVTLRPAGLPAQQIELGRIEAGSALIVPLHGIAPSALAAGAIELEVIGDTQVVWTTLALPARAVAATLARAE